MNNAFEELLKVANDNGTHIPAVHHMKKKVSDDTMDGILGSTAIGGGAETNIALTADRGGQRIIASRQGYGTDMPETQLIWCPDTKEARLGATADEAAQQAALQTSKRIDAAIMDYVRANPTSEQAEVFAAIKGNTRLKKLAFKQIVESGVLIESGGGVKGSPFTYRLADVPIGL